MGDFDHDADLSTDEEAEKEEEINLVPFPKPMHMPSKYTDIFNQGVGKIPSRTLLRRATVRLENLERAESREIAEADWLEDAHDVEPDNVLNDELAEKINSLDIDALVLFALTEAHEALSVLKGALDRNPRMPKKRAANAEVQRLVDKINFLELQAKDIFEVDLEWQTIERERMGQTEEQVEEVEKVEEGEEVEEVEKRNEQEEDSLAFQVTGTEQDEAVGKDGDGSDHSMEDGKVDQGHIHSDVGRGAGITITDLDGEEDEEPVGNVETDTNAVPPLPKRIEKEIDNERERRMLLSELLQERLLYQHSETLKMMVDAYIAHPLLFEKFGSNVMIWMDDLLERAGNDASNIIFLKNPRPDSVREYMTEEEVRSHANVDVSGVDEHDPKTKTGMLAFLRHLSARKFGTETRAGNGGLPPASQERIDGGNHVGDELTKRIILLVLKNLRRKGQHHSDIRVRKLCYLLQSQLNRIHFRMGDLHFAMAGYDAAERTYQNGGQASLCHVMGRRDTIRATHLSKAFQTHQKVLDEMLGGRTCAFLVEMMENGKLPMPTFLFPICDLTQKQILNAKIFSSVFTGSVYDVDIEASVNTMSDMHHYWGCQFSMVVGGAKEIMESTRWKDSECMDMLAKLFFPLMIQLDKSNYSKLLESEIEQMLIDSPFRRDDWIKHRFVNRRSDLGHAVGRDCTLENAMLELKPIQRNLSEETMIKFSRHLFLLTSIRRMFDMSGTLGGRERGVRAHRQAPRLKMLLKVATFFLNTGVCSEHNSSRRHEWKVGNETFHRTAHKLDKIGEAMSFEGKIIDLTSQQALELGVVVGKYKCVRAQCLPPVGGQEQAELLLQPWSQ